jgi:hypothetical protein
MVKLVKTKYNDKTFYVRLTTVKEFGIPAGIWLSIEDDKIYHSDDLIFLRDV